MELSAVVFSGELSWPECVELSNFSMSILEPAELVSEPEEKHHSGEPERNRNSGEITSRHSEGILHRALQVHWVFLTSP